MTANPASDDLPAVHVPCEPEVEERPRYQSNGVQGEVEIVPLFREDEHRSLYCLCHATGRSQGGSLLEQQVADKRYNTDEGERQKETEP